MRYHILSHLLSSKQNDANRRGGCFCKVNRIYSRFGIKNIEKHENQVLEYGLEKLRKDNSVSIIGNPNKRASIMSFTIKGIHPHDIATILDDDGVAIRASHHCCQILHDKLGISASARALNRSV